MSLIGFVDPEQNADVNIFNITHNTGRAIWIRALVAFSGVTCIQTLMYKSLECKRQLGIYVKLALI